MKVAVTGASGFVGRYVVAELLRRGDVDVTTCGRSPVEMLVGQRAHIVCDLASPDDRALAELALHDVLIHLAWGGLPNYGALSHVEQELPRHYHFLTTIARLGLPRIVSTGTCLEYGRRDGALSADTQTSPETAYALAKDMLHKQLKMSLAETACDLVWARLFYMYGVGQAPSSLYSQLGRAVENRAKDFAMSSGEQLRDFLPAQTVARDIVSLAIAADPAAVVNVCSGEPRSVRRMVEQWLSDWGAEIELTLGVYPLPSYEALAFWGVRGPGLDGLN